MSQSRSCRGTDASKRSIFTRENAASAVALGLSVWLFYILAIGGGDPWLMRNVVLTAGALLVLLLKPVSKSATRSAVLDSVFILATIATGVYIWVNFSELVFRMRVSPTPLDVAFAICATVIVLEVTRRAEGMPLAVLAIIAIVYARYGNYFPGMFRTRGYSVRRIMGMVFGTDGIYGTALGAASTYALLFIIFGSFLQASKAGDFFINLANAIAGRARGGPAKIAIVASSLFGTISGSSVANVVTTGTLTIPAMKKTGYKASFAAAVEAVASTGGQLVPPVMGAAAFIMAEYLGIPYLQIVTAAIVPAVFYYAALYWMVHLRATRRDLRGMSRDELPSLVTVMRDGWHLLIPVAVLLYVLIGMKASAIRAGLAGIITCVVASWFKSSTRMNVKDILRALEQGARSSTSVIVTCATSGIIVAVFSLTGLGLKLASAILAYSHGSLAIALVLSMLIAIILGMGVPSVPAYAICASVVAPALVQMGVEPLAAHMFVFYFSALSAVTPPVALAAYAAAGIADANPMQAGWDAFSLALGGFLVPYLFVYEPSVILFNAPAWTIASVIISGLVGIVALGMAIEGWIFKKATWMERALLALAAVLLIKPGTVTDIVGVVLIVVAAYGNKRRA